MHDLDCCTGTGTRAWHHAWCAWYDHREAGHRVRSAFFGWLADRIVRWA